MSIDTAPTEISIKEEPATLKTWSSFPELIESCESGSNLITMKENSGLDKNDVNGQAFELSDVIKVDYSEIKTDAPATFNETKTKTG